MQVSMIFVFLWVLGIEFRSYIVASGASLLTRACPLCIDAALAYRGHRDRCGRTCACCGRGGP